MSILNYFLIGFIFTFLMDILLDGLKSRGLLDKTIEWDWLNRSLCIIIWPIAAAWFFISFFMQYFRK